MNEEVSILPLLIIGGIVLCFGYEVNRRRHKLRKIFNIFDKSESEIAQALEIMVESGQLRPYVPSHAG
jgi:hypothetical protein